MAYRLETPSRIWARIEEAQDEELPSLPSMPGYEDSAFPDESEAVSIQHSYYPTPNKVKTPSSYTPTPRPAKIRAMSTPLSAGETTARPPLGRSGSSFARSRDTPPSERFLPSNKDDEEISTSLTDDLETESRSGSPDDFGDNQSQVSVPHRSIKDIYNNSGTPLRDSVSLLLFALSFYEAYLCSDPITGPGSSHHWTLNSHQALAPCKDTCPSPISYSNTHPFTSFCHLGLVPTHPNYPTAPSQPFSVWFGLRP
jgi:hypothetical protein